MPVQKNTDAVSQNDAVAQKENKQTLAIKANWRMNFRCIFYPGGHGPFVGLGKRWHLDWSNETFQ